MDMLDTSHYNPNPPISLDGIATQVYGRKYVGQQTGDMIGNDTFHFYDLERTYDVQEEILDRRNWYAPEMWMGISQCILTLESWLADVTEYDYDFQHYRKGPEPRTMLAHLINDGHLPYGRYLLRVSW